MSSFRSFPSLPSASPPPQRSALAAPAPPPSRPAHGRVTLLRRIVTNLAEEAKHGSESEKHAARRGEHASSIAAAQQHRRPAAPAPASSSAPSSVRDSRARWDGGFGSSSDVPTPPGMDVFQSYAARSGSAGTTLTGRPLPNHPSSSSAAQQAREQLAASMASAIADARPADIRALARETIAMQLTLDDQLHSASFPHGASASSSPSRAHSASRSRNAARGSAAGQVASRAPIAAPPAFAAADAAALLRGDHHAAAPHSRARKALDDILGSQQLPSESLFPHSSPSRPHSRNSGRSSRGRGGRAAIAAPPPAAADALSSSAPVPPVAPSASVVSTLEDVLRSAQPHDVQALLESGGAFSVELLLRLSRTQKDRQWKDLSEVASALAALRHISDGQAPGSASPPPPAILAEVVSILSSPTCSLLPSRSPLQQAQLASLFRASGHATAAVLRHLQHSSSVTFPSVDALVDACGSTALSGVMSILALLPVLLVRPVDQSPDDEGSELEIAWALFEHGGSLMDHPSSFPVASTTAATVCGPDIVVLLHSFSDPRLRMKFSSVAALASALRHPHAAMESAAAAVAAAAALSPRSPGRGGAGGGGNHNPAAIASLVAILNDPVVNFFPSHLNHAVTPSSPELHELVTLAGGADKALLDVQEIVRVRRGGIDVVGDAPAADVATTAVPSSSQPLFPRSWAALLRLIKRLRAREGAIKSFLSDDASSSACSLLAPSARGKFNAIELTKLNLIAAGDVILASSLTGEVGGSASKRCHRSASAVNDVKSFSAVSLRRGFSSDDDDDTASNLTLSSSPRSSRVDRPLRSLLSPLSESLATGTQAPGPSVLSRELAKRKMFLKANPVVGIFVQMQEQGESGFRDLASLTLRVAEVYAERTQLLKAQRSRLRAALESSRGQSLSPVVSVREEDVTHVWEDLVENKAEGKVDWVIQQIDAMNKSMPSSSSESSPTSLSSPPAASRPQHASFDSFFHALSSALDTFLQERAALYHFLHSPSCNIFLSQQSQRGGAGGAASTSMAPYTAVSYAVIDALLSSVGPSPRNVQSFLASLSQEKTRVPSAAKLVALAQEKGERDAALMARREANQIEVRNMVHEWVGQNQTMFPGLCNSSSSVSITEGVMDSFLLAVGMKLFPASLPAEEDMCSVQSLLGVLDELRYAGRTFLISSAGQKGEAESTAAVSEVFSKHGALVKECLRVQAEIAAHKQLVWEWMRFHAESESGFASSALRLALLHPALLSTLSLTPDIDVLFSRSQAGLHLLRVLEQIHAIQHVALQSGEDAFAADDDDEHDHDDTMGLTNTSQVSTKDQISSGPFLALETLTAAAKEHYHSSFLPLQKKMHSTLRQELSLVVAGGWSVRDLDGILDTFVLHRVTRWAREGLVPLVRVREQHRDFVADIAGEGNASHDDQEDRSKLSLVQALSVAFHELLHVGKIVSPLPENTESSCSGTMNAAAFSSAVDSFFSTQRTEFNAWISSEIASVLFDASSLSAVQSTLAAVSATTGGLIDVMLGSFFHSRALEGIAFLEKILRRGRAARARWSRLDPMPPSSASKAKGAGDVQSASLLFSGLIRPCGSLKQLVMQVGPLVEQHARVLDQIVVLVSASGLLDVHDTVSTATFAREHASLLVDLFDSIPEDRIVDLVNNVLLVLVQRNEEKLQSTTSSNGDPLIAESSQRSVAFNSPETLVQASKDLLDEEVSSVQRVFSSSAVPLDPSDDNEPAPSAVESESFGEVLFSFALHKSLLTSPSSSLMEDAWFDILLASGFSSSTVERWARSRVRARSVLASKVVPTIQTLGELVCRINEAAQEDRVKQVAFLEQLQAAGLLQAPSSDAASTPSSHVALQAVMGQCFELLDSKDSSSPIPDDFLRSLASKHSPAQGFSGVYALQRFLRPLVDAARAERARVAEEARQKRRQAARAAWELKRLEAERAEVRHRIRTYLLSPECSLFTANTIESIRKQLASPAGSVLAPSVHSSDALVDGLLLSCKGDLAVLFRSMEGLQCRDDSKVDSLPHLATALQQQSQRFDADCTGLISWISYPDTMQSRACPGEEMSLWTAEKEGAELMVQFDREAQMGCAQVQALVTAVVSAVLDARAAAAAAGALGASSSSDPAFSSFSALRAAMESHRAAELAALMEWLELPAASSVFSNPEEIETSTGGLLRLLLSAPSFLAVRESLRWFQACSKCFDSVAALAAAVGTDQFDRRDAFDSFCEWIGRSGLLQKPLSNTDKKQLAALVLNDGINRVSDELVVMQQELLASPVAPDALTSSSAADSSSSTPAQPREGFASAALLLDVLAQRRTRALDSMRSFLSGDETRTFLVLPAGEGLTDVQLHGLLHACVDGAMLPEILRTLHSHFDDVSSMELSVRRIMHATWSEHRGVQDAARAAGAMSQSPLALELSLFDTRYMRSLVPRENGAAVEDQQRTLLASFAHLTVSGRAFERVSMLVDAVSEVLRPFSVLLAPPAQPADISDPVALDSAAPAVTAPAHATPEEISAEAPAAAPMSTAAAKPVEAV